MLECLNFDGNAIVQQVRRYGGQLEFLLANLFQYVPLSDDGGLTLSCRRHDEYMVAPQTVDDLERAITQGQEAVVEEFLITGAVSNHGDRAGIAFPPPAPPRELSPPLCRSQLNSDAEDGRIAADSAVILSKEHKLAMWKRLQDSRKPHYTSSDAYVDTEHDEGRSKSAAWEQIEPVYNRSVALALPQDRGRSPAYTTTGDFSVTPPFEHNTPAVVVPTSPPIQESVMATNDLIKVSPLLRDAGSDAQQTRIKKLNEQVATMRKYMKVTTTTVERTVPTAN
ncbi:hypothetical protein BBJ28_00001339 [Nothophytophthora sp. Chile5]|nr:hypothetical protein BBJ28_00001339 [Nothophytophthora sp. Chile5]